MVAVESVADEVGVGEASVQISRLQKRPSWKEPQVCVVFSRKGHGGAINLVIGLAGNEGQGRSLGLAYGCGCHGAAAA